MTPKSSLFLVFLLAWALLSNAASVNPDHNGSTGLLHEDTCPNDSPTVVVTDQCMAPSEGAHSKYGTSRRPSFLDCVATNPFGMTPVASRTEWDTSPM